MQNKASPSQRRKARRLALQAIYQWQLSGHTTSEIEAQFLEDQVSDKVDIPYFLELLRGVPLVFAELDAQMHPFLDRPLDNLNPIELAILRIAIYEFLHRLDIPYRVVIDEALRLAKAFGAQEGYKYVNAILDQVAKVSRKK